MSFARLKDIFLNAAHNIETFVHSRVNTVTHAVRSTIDTIQQTEGSLAKKAVEGLKDVWAGLRESEAMPAHQRHLDEFKMLVGGVATTVGTIEANPIFAGSGAVPAWEAVLDVGKAGHQWRAQHHKI